MRHHKQHPKEEIIEEFAIFLKYQIHLLEFGSLFELSFSMPYFLKEKEFIVRA